MFTCFVKYSVDVTKLKDFERYARTWIKLIEKYGGTHHGYFLPDAQLEKMYNASFSFPELGCAGEANTAVALFSFADAESYDAYRKGVADDPECKEITDFFLESKCFTHYERNFLSPIFE